MPATATMGARLIMIVALRSVAKPIEPATGNTQQRQPDVGDAFRRIGYVYSGSVAVSIRVRLTGVKTHQILVQAARVRARRHAALEGKRPSERTCR